MKTECFTSSTKKNPTASVELYKTHCIKLKTKAHHGNLPWLSKCWKVSRPWKTEMVGESTKTVKLVQKKCYILIDCSLRTGFVCSSFHEDYDLTLSFSISILVSPLKRLAYILMKNFCRFGYLMSNLINTCWLYASYKRTFFAKVERFKI